MASAFRKISRVGNFTGGTKWYLSEDCLLAARRMLYAVEYRRFYLLDLQSIVVWPNRLWLLRLITPFSVIALGATFWKWVDSTSGWTVTIAGLVWAALEFALGPTAQARIRTTGATVDLPLVKRICAAQRVLTEIDAAVRASRAAMIEAPPVTSAGPRLEGPSIQTDAETAPATAATPIEDLT